VIGGWVAARVAGIRHSEDAMFHGAIAFLIATPLLIALASLGAGSYFGGWHSGLAGRPSWAGVAAAPYEKPESLPPMATESEIIEHKKAMAEYQTKARQWREETPRATRNAAIGAATALLIGLIGSVIGGWMASGEPMTLTYRRARTNHMVKAA
jgi:hypothetical protein